MQSELILIPNVTIHPDRICTYSQVHWLPYKPPKYENDNGVGIRKIKYDHLLSSARSANGNVSIIAKRKITKALDYLLLMARNKRVTSRYTGKTLSFKIAFITLTLPSKQIHDDNTIKQKCLNSFLIEIKKYYKVHNYIWRAEKQKNGNIHFHILIDKFIDWNELRNRWNRIVNKLGYVTRYREEMLKFHSGGFKVRSELLKQWDYKKQLKAYKAGKLNDWHSPNSTDIHSIRSIINIKLYIGKYMTKNEMDHKENTEKIEEVINQSGRIWSCNVELSKIKGARTEVDNEIWDEINNAVENSGCHSFTDKYFKVFFIDFEELSKLQAPTLFKLFLEYLYDEFGFSYQLSTDQ